MSEKANYTVGSGNVFKDLGFDRPDEELAKSDLAIQISKIIQQKGWTQKKPQVFSASTNPKYRLSKTDDWADFLLSDYCLSYGHWTGTSISSYVRKPRM